MTAMLDRVVPSIISAADAGPDTTGESPSTTLVIWPITDAKRVARLVMFLHTVGVAAVGFEPQTGERYAFEIAMDSEDLLRSFLDSAEFRPKSLRSFASSRLEICLER